MKPSKKIHSVVEDLIDEARLTRATRTPGSTSRTSRPSFGHETNDSESVHPADSSPRARGSYTSSELHSEPPTGDDGEIPVDEDPDAARRHRRRLLVIALIAVVFFVGFFLGRGTDDPIPPPPERVTVTKTETKVVPKEIPAVPDSCRSALEYVHTILDESGTIIDASPQERDIIAAAYQAMLRKDWKALNVQRFKQEQLKHDTTDAYVNLLNTRNKADKYIDACLKEVER